MNMILRQLEMLSLGGGAQEKAYDQSSMNSMENSATTATSTFSAQQMAAMLSEQMQMLEIDDIDETNISAGQAQLASTEMSKDYNMNDNEMNESDQLNQSN